MIPLAVALAFALPALSARPGQAAPARARADRAAEPGAAGEDVPGKPRRIAVLRFAGRGAEVARAAVTDALAEELTLELVPIRLLEAQQDLTGSVEARTVELGRRLQLTALVRGRVKKVGRNLRATLTVVGGADAAVLGTVDIQARTFLALHGKLRSSIWAKLMPLIDRARAPEPAAERPPAAVPETPPPVVEKESPVPEERAAPAPPPPAHPRRSQPAPQAQPDDGSEAEPPPAPPASRRCGIVELEPGGGVLLRRFDYRNEQRGALRGYTLKRSPDYRIEGSFYPIMGGACRHGVAFGFRGAYERMAPVVSHLADNEVNTAASAYQVEAVLRITSGALTLKPSAGYFVRSYVVEEDLVPFVDYRAVGASLDAELRLGLFVLELGAGGRYLLKAAELKSPDWFPQATALGYTVRAHLGVAVTDWLDFLIGATGEEYLFTFHTTNTGAYPNGVAAGAYDAYLVATAALRVRFPGNGRRP